jgi:chromatin segregation and condensation protein Rec8/ScpA/Scc1 (kleisin family)
VEIIATFLSLLELLRRRLATARQAEPLGPIMVYRAVEQDEDEVSARPPGAQGS